MGKEFNKIFGDACEEAAEIFLENKGYEIIAKKFFFRGGEIDLIAKKDGWLVFVEVKAKRSEEFGAPVEMITSFKTRRLLKTAQFYMKQNNIDPENTNWRFDVVSVMIKGSERIFEHIENAITF
jgi:putative endonuclease